MKTALIGYGYWGPNLAKNLNATDGVELAGICELNQHRRAKAQSLYSADISYPEDYHAFLADETIDAIAIATPTEASYQIAIDALNAGKHIFIEKPIATTVARAEALRKLAEANGLVIHCDHIMLYHPVIRYVKQMIDTGELGDLIYIDVTRTNLGPLRKDVNVLLDLAVHDIAVIDYLSDGAECRHVYAVGQTGFGKQEVLTYLTIQYKSFIAHIKSSWISPIKERRTIIAGTKKMAIFDDVAANKLVIYDKGFDLEQTEEYGMYEFHVRKGDIYIPYIEEEDALKNSVVHFKNCVRNKSQSLSGAEHSIKVMQVLENAIGQMEEGKNGTV